MRNACETRPIATRYRALPAPTRARSAARHRLDAIANGEDNAQPKGGPGTGTTTLTSSVGPYQIVGALGMGSYGIVHRAVHDVSKQHVALKTVRISAPRWLESIRREIRALTRIAHPGIVRIVDHGIHESRPWYAMQLLEGETLRSFGERILL